MKTKKIRLAFTSLIILCLISTLTALSQDVFRLKPYLSGQHPRILFTQDEANERAVLAKQYMPEDWKSFVSQCLNIGYPSNKSIPGQQQWWYFSRLGIGIALTKDQNMIDKARLWLSTCYKEKWDFDEDKTVGLDIAHKLAGFALLYDCMYNYLDKNARADYEKLLETGLIKFRTHGFDIGDYWTNDYQNNHNHFRATASLYCSVILIDKVPGIQAEADSIMKVWRRIAYMSPHDGSNHEGLNYSNYGGQMLYPGIYALKHCTDLDLTKSEHYHNVGYYYLYHTVPGFVSGFGFGDAANSAAASGPNYLFQIANFTKDPYIQYLAHQLKEKYPKNFDLLQWYILFNDPFLKPKDPSDLPLHRYFDDIGIVISRSSWDPDATAVAFKCGPLGGKLLNETLGTEYSHFTNYINVAHDDPDAGTFLLFSKGDFLTTGDGYEKKKKVTSQHSTFIVDDLTQYGGGRPWSQPENDLGRYAWQKDFAAVNDRIVFSGDMKGVYPDMEKLTRTFVSHKAKYMIIYDDAASKLPGRNFEWRLQTKGTLSEAGQKTYKITNGEGSSLVNILTPTEADWSVTTNNIGNVLCARLSSQQKNNFMVLLWPGASNLNAISQKYNSAGVVGVKVTWEGNNEYTLFQKTDNIPASAGNIDFNGNTLLLIENNAGKNLISASLVNGNKLSYNSVNYFSSTDRINFGIESISADKAEVKYNIGVSSASVSPKEVKIILGGLIKNSSYYLIKEGDKTGIEFKTDRKGQAFVSISPDKACRYIASNKK